MNMQAMMAQAQKLQKDIMVKKEEINNKEFSEKNDLVEIVVMGNKKIKKITINKSAADDLETLEDMILIAYNKALEKIEKETEKVLGAYGSLNGLI
jgi:DNA-binding YbaB/EbfC family protein